VELVFLGALRSRPWAQPQRDMGWLHRLPYHHFQFVVQGVQVRLVPQFECKALEGLSSIVLASIEAAVYVRLNSSTQGVNKAAITRVEATMASCGDSSWPVSAWKIAWVAVTLPK
jgi:hypothetical protein